MLRVLSKRCLGVLLLAGAVAACDDDASPTTPAPAAPVTETFAGLVTQNGAASHSFAASAGGAITATLKTIGTDNRLVVGFGLGNWNSTNSSCSLVVANDAATGGAVLSGTLTAAGTLCVRVYDVGNIAGPPAPYSIEVVHP